MDLITNLGINGTIFYQFVIFLVAYLALNQFVFKPYIAAFEERESRTSGQTKAAETSFEDATRLKEEYANMMKAQLEETQAFYTKAKKEAGEEYNKIVEAAKIQAKTEIDKAKIEITNQMSAAQTSVEAEAKALASIITQKVVGREL